MKNEEKPENQHAFAYGYGTDNYDRAQEGMTLRDYFANSAMQSLIPMFLGHSTKQDIVKLSYEIADEMLKQREL